jgi:[CysO sulfur-carrier protein]-thiocarboxylate-dependent cysteine synthase
MRGVGFGISATLTAMDVLELTGNTPLVELKHCSPKPGVRLFAKLEGQNPTGSVKDRIVSYMLNRARAEGRLEPGQEIVEATTGNTGIALAMAGRRLGHPVRLVVPQTAFSDVTRALQAWEPRIEWVSADQGIKSAIMVAKQIATHDGAFLLNQFSSPDNPRCHYETTAAEILTQLPEVDVFVCGLGTSGTAMGVGQRLKEQDRHIQVVVAEPHPGHSLQGIRSLDDGYIPEILNLGLLDSKILVRSADAFRAVREVLRRDGVLAGLSSGAVLHAALKWASRVEKANVVMLFADSGWKYLNSPAFMLDESLEDPNQALDEVLWW